MRRGEIIHSQINFTFAGAGTRINFVMTFWHREGFLGLRRSRSGEKHFEGKTNNFQRMRMMRKRSGETIWLSITDCMPASWVVNARWSIFLLALDLFFDVSLVFRVFISRDDGKKAPRDLRKILLTFFFPFLRWTFNYSIFGVDSGGDWVNRRQWHNSSGNIVFGAISFAADDMHEFFETIICQLITIKN